MQILQLSMRFFKTGATGEFFFSPMLVVKFPTMFTLFLSIFPEGLSALATKLFIYTNFSFITNILQVRMVYRDLTNFGEADKSSDAPPIKVVVGENLAKSTK